MANQLETSDVRRAAGWLPDQDGLEAWLTGHRQRVEEQGQDVALHPVITEFQHLIASDPVVRMYVERMITQVPRSRDYQNRHLTSTSQLLRLINAVLSMAPEFGDQSVTLPLGAILDWTMGTDAGFAAYRDPRVNAIVRKILTAWCEFLSGPDSRYVLNDSPTGWRSEAAQRAIGIDQYHHDPLDQYWGFSSWNDFFTRRFKPGQRPVAAPDDDTVIANACESTPYGLSTNVQRHDRFWIKSQPYSLHDMLAADESVDRFVGGTVYQAFLSATNYHRWHSPVAGTVLRAFVVAGTYYSEADSEGADAVEPMNSQSYLAHIATRAILVIEADNPHIGTMAVVAVGMSEVSSCIIGEAVTPGAHVGKGDELGYFQFGGSTHCLIFRPGVIDEFALTAIPPTHGHAAPLMLVGAKLATATG